jgi:hypothetical protein
VGQESHRQPAVVETHSGVSGGIRKCRQMPPRPLKRTVICRSMSRCAAGSGAGNVSHRDLLLTHRRGESNPSPTVYKAGALRSVSSQWVRGGYLSPISSTFCSLVCSVAFRSVSVFCWRFCWQMNQEHARAVGHLIVAWTPSRAPVTWAATNIKWTQPLVTAERTRSVTGDLVRQQDEAKASVKAEALSKN